MLTVIPVVVHERRANWAPRLRARLSETASRICETRSGRELAAVLGRSDCAVVVVDLSNRGLAAIEEMAIGLENSAGGLVLVLNPQRVDGVEPLARQVGATEVWSGPIAPPRVADQLSWWIELQIRRRARLGWFPSDSPDRDPVDMLISQANWKKASSGRAQAERA